MTPSSERYSTADALLDALQEWGVSCLFSNLGSDHPAIIEGLAKAKAEKRPLPEVIICPHEFVAVSASHGHTLVSGKAQAIIVHTDVGTQNMGGSLHNIQRSRVPAFIFAGETPFTMDGELPGGRNTPINHLQNVYDQRGLVRSYVKWDCDIRTGRNVKQLIHRGMQIANSDPKGPVYLTGAREVLEEDVSPSSGGYITKWMPIEKTALPADGVERIAEALLGARQPLIITSYLGRNAEAVGELVHFCEKLAVPVIEMSGSHVNFPGNHPLHQGYQGGELLAEADVILVIDCDVPWVSALSRPSEHCQVFYIDIDPLKEEVPIWYMQTERFYRADSLEALKQLNAYIGQEELQAPEIEDRAKHLAEKHHHRRQEWSERERSNGEVITPEWLTACIREVIDDDTVVMNETITNAAVVSQHLPRTKPGTMFVNGGTSLGWSGGAAIGAKLAAPHKTVVNLTGDGCYIFGAPSAVYWMSRRYQAPILTVIYNNQGWNATKLNLLKLYPDGIAKRDDRYWVNFDQPADLAKIAEAAGGAYARTVYHPDDVKEALQSGMDAVRNGRAAVIDVRLPKISNQTD